MMLRLERVVKAFAAGFTPRPSLQAGDIPLHCPVPPGFRFERLWI
jgi:hypothetical protein